ARMKSRTSGWDTSKVPICAPRRPPADETVKHILSKMSMKDIGPEVYAPAPATDAPRGRRVENSWPMPQAALRVRPASWTFSRMPSMGSTMVPDTVQLIVLVAGLWARAPALEVMRPAGVAPRRSAHRKRSFQYWRLSALGSASARALATRW